MQTVEVGGAPDCTMGHGVGRALLKCEVELFDTQLQHVVRSWLETMSDHALAASLPGLVCTQCPRQLQTKCSNYFVPFPSYRLFLKLAGS